MGFGAGVRKRLNSHFGLRPLLIDGAIEFEKTYMNTKPTLLGLSLTAVFCSGAQAAEPFVTSGLAISAFETARAVRESADERMTRAVTDTERADGGNIWLELKGGTDEADGMGRSAGFDNDLAIVNLGADIRRGDAFFGVVYTYGRADTESRGAETKADGKADLFGITAFGERNFGGLNLGVSAGWLWVEGDSKTGGAWHETNANIITFDAAARYDIVAGPLQVVPYAKVEYTLFRPRVHGNWELDNANIWQFPVGVNAAWTFKFAGGSTLHPEIDAAVIRTAGDTEFDSRDAHGRVYSETLTGSHTLYRAQAAIAWTAGKGSLKAVYRYLGSDQGRESHNYQLKAGYTF